MVLAKQVWRFGDRIGNTATSSLCILIEILRHIISATKQLSHIAIVVVGASSSLDLRHFIILIFLHIICLLRTLLTLRHLLLDLIGLSGISIRLRKNFLSLILLGRRVCLLSTERVLIRIGCLFFICFFEVHAVSTVKVAFCA